MVYQKNRKTIIRPLLNMHRFEIRQFVRFWKLPVYSDQSNQKTNYLRNKIRKQLMPTLRIFFNPQIDTVLLNFMEIKKDEQKYFQNALNILWKPQQCEPFFIFSIVNISNNICFYNQKKVVIKYENKKTNFSRNQIIYWLIINNNLVHKINSYPNIFQKKILKTILKTFNEVENASLNLRFSKSYEQQLTQLFLLILIKKLFTLQEKRSLLLILKTLTN